MKTTIKDIIHTALTDVEALDIFLYVSPVITFLVSIIIFLELNRGLWE